MSIRDTIDEAFEASDTNPAIVSALVAVADGAKIEGKAELLRELREVEVDLLRAVREDQAEAAIEEKGADHVRFYEGRATGYKLAAEHLDRKLRSESELLQPAEADQEPES